MGGQASCFGCFTPGITPHAHWTGHWVSCPVSFIKRNLCFHTILQSIRIEKPAYNKNCIKLNLFSTGNLSDPVYTGRKTTQKACACNKRKLFVTNTRDVMLMEKYLSAASCSQNATDLSFFWNFSK
jgi:hypothetical protein